MKPAVKASRVEMEGRITEVLQYITLGLTRAQIVQKGSKDWNVSVRQVDDYIKAATKVLRDEANVDRAKHVGKAIRRLEYIFLKTMSVQDYQRALAAQRELNLLLGLHEPTRIDATTDGQPIQPTINLYHIPAREVGEDKDKS